MENFSNRLISWQRHYGRHDLPWQQPDAYRVWLSEIMLQQTQVVTVIPYFQKFIACFPTVQDLAGAAEADVMALWAGLGYYARARHLLAAARQVVTIYAGVFPKDPDVLVQLPGIGRSTAGAIAALAYGVRAPILDGNVRRVLIRHQALRMSGRELAEQKQLWALADALTPSKDVAIYTQAMMDLGALVCQRKQPDCSICPIAGDCQSRQRGITDLLPLPANKPVVQRKNLWLVVLMAGDRVWLERRPSRGIWAGLWCFPVCDALPDATQITQLAGGVVVDISTGSAFRHALTHRDLHITPVMVKLSGVSVQTSGWIRLSAVIAQGVPVPVKRIVEEYLHVD